MKRIVLIFIVLSTLNSAAQDPQLSENTWYLQNVIISGVDNFPPSNLEVPSILLEFFTVNDFHSYVCNSLFGDLVFDDALSNFTFTFITETLILCEFPENTNYENLYFSVFYLANESTPFTYSIIHNTDDTKTLTITGANGDQAIYSSALLHLNEQKIAEIKTFPNPIEDVIRINKGRVSGEIQLSVYDISGKLKLAKKLNTPDTISIDTSPLTTGVYFFIFETDDGRIETQKIIKN